MASVENRGYLLISMPRGTPTSTATSSAAALISRCVTSAFTNPLDGSSAYSSDCFSVSTLQLQGPGRCRHPLVRRLGSSRGRGHTHETLDQLEEQVGSHRQRANAYEPRVQLGGVVYIIQAIPEQLPQPTRADPGSYGRQRDCRQRG